MVRPGSSSRRLTALHVSLLSAAFVGATPTLAHAQTPFGDPMDLKLVREFLPPEGFGARHPDAHADLEQFGRLAGIWVAEQDLRRQDGSWLTAGPALWVWRYALGGFAVQDLWIQTAEHLPVYLEGLGRDYLLSAIRIYSPASGAWHVAWMANGQGATPGQDFGTFDARMDDGRLVLTSEPGGSGPLQRVVFSDFTADSFLWLSEMSMDDGATWTAVMRVRAQRHR